MDAAIPVLPSPMMKPRQTENSAGDSASELRSKPETDLSSTGLKKKVRDEVSTSSFQTPGSAFSDSILMFYFHHATSRDNNKGHIIATCCLKYF